MNAITIVLCALFGVFGLLAQSTTVITYAEVSLGVPPITSDPPQTVEPPANAKAYTGVNRLRVAPNGTVVADLSRGPNWFRAFVMKTPPDPGFRFLSDRYAGFIESEELPGGIGQFLVDNSQALVSGFSYENFPGYPGKWVTTTTQFPFTGPVVELYSDFPANFQNYIGIFPSADGMYTQGTDCKNCSTPTAGQTGVYKFIWRQGVTGDKVQFQTGGWDIVFKTDPLYEFKSVWKLSNGGFIADRKKIGSEVNEVVLFSPIGTVQQVLSSPQSLGFTPATSFKLIVDPLKSAALIGTRDSNGRYRVSSWIVGANAAKDVYVAGAGQSIAGFVTPADFKSGWALLLGASTGSSPDTLLRVNLATGAQSVVVTRGTQVLGASIQPLNPEQAGIDANGVPYFGVNNQKVVRADVSTVTVVIPPPTISKLEVTPSTVERGTTATIQWSVDLVPGSVIEVSINNGLGALPMVGNRTVTPDATTEYILTAKGPGGTVSKTVVLTVTAPVVPITKVKIDRVVNAATYNIDPLAPGTWFSVYGINLGKKAIATESVYDLQGTSVSICGAPAVVYSNSGADVSGPGTLGWQVNALVPYDLVGRTSCQVIVTVNGESSLPMDVKMAEESFGIFMFTQSAPMVNGDPIGPDLVLPVGTNSSDGSVIGPKDYNLSPAKKGGVITLWATGCSSSTNPVITIGEVTAEVLFSGPSPGQPGLCQVNLRIPDQTKSGLQTMLVGTYKLSLAIE